jgi:hypothetical protein
MMKKLCLAALAGSVVQFLLGFLVYGLLLASFMDANTIHYEGLMKDMNSASFIILIFLAGLVMSTLIAFIFQRWAKFDKFSAGFTGGMVLGFFISLSYDLSSYSMMNLVSVGGFVVDVIVATILTGIVGGTIAWVLGMKGKEQPAPVQ